MVAQNATQRAVIRYSGNDTYPLFIESPGNKIFILDIAVPTNMNVASVTVKTLSGTITVNVQKVSGGVTTSLTGASAIAVTSTVQTVAVTNDGNNVLAAGDTLQITTSAGAAPADLALTVNFLRTSGNQ